MLKSRIYSVYFQSIKRRFMGYTVQEVIKFLSARVNKWFTTIFDKTTVN